MGLLRSTATRYTCGLVVRTRTHTYCSATASTCVLYHRHRPQIKGARLVANPGCYPTSVQLPLIPLLQAGLIASDEIVINSMSGVSGAGRSAKQNLLYTEIAESVNAYGITRHRHVPEIEQGLAEACGKEVTVSFTPNLMPMSRGMQSTCYVKLSQGASVDDLRASLAVRAVQTSDENCVEHVSTGPVRG